MSTDYFPPIQRAVQGLSPNTLDARKALYDKARTALLKQLRNADPALTDSQITKERLLLEDAIRRIETEMLRPETAEAVLGVRPTAEPPPPLPSARYEPPAPVDEAVDEDGAYADEAHSAYAPAPDPYEEEAAPPTPRRRRSDSLRPPAPRRGVDEDRRSQRFALLGGAALLVILAAAGAVALIRGRDADDAAQQVSRQAAPQAAPASTPAPAPQGGGKLGDRIGDAAPGPSSPPSTPAPSTPSTDSPPPLVAAPAVPAPANPGQVASAQPLSPVQPGAGAGVGTAVAQQATLWEEQPDNPQQSQAFRGTVTWRTESVSSSANAPLETAIKGEIDIPERKLKAAITLRRNVDPALPASHTLEIQFTVPSSFPNGGITNVPGVLMKQSAETRGQPLAGLSVKVTSGYFLVGLQDTPTEVGRNARLLRDQEWVDIPMLYDNGRRAILTLEKGVPGDRAFADAFSAWDVKPQNAQQP